MKVLEDEIKWDISQPKSSWNILEICQDFVKKQSSAYWSY